MQDRPLTNVKDEALLEHLRFIYENAQSNDVKVVTATPTTDNLRPKDPPQLLGTDLYMNIEGTLYKLALTAA